MNKSLHSKSRLMTMTIKNLFGLFLLIGATVNANLASAQDCNVIMACNNQIQVSLGDNCTEVISPAMILEGQAYPNNFYTVTVTTQSGTVIPGAVMTYAHIGQLFNASVTLNNCGLSCWGTFTVEDKKPPVVSTCKDATINCGDSTNPSSQIPTPVFIDNCNIPTLKREDSETVLPCSNPFVKKIVRNWTASDQSGNKATCVQNIFVRRASISDVTFPGDLVLQCNANIPTLPNGAPNPDYSGYPNGTACPNMQFYYTDVIFPLCGSSVKVLRQWVVIDWCTGRDTTGNQTIKLVDSQPPVCAAPVDFSQTIGTDAGKCTGTLTVPPPVVVYDCSKTDYIVGYKLRDNSGQPFVNPIYDNVVKHTNPNGTYYYTISGLPQDTSWIVYTVTDECGNSTMCFTEIYVVDDDAPSAICEGYTVVSLSDDGWADVAATSINSGSEDNCEIVDFKVKRQTNTCSKPEDLQFQDKVNFCCLDASADPNFYVKVVLRVFDKAGNYNDCVANVKVQDKKTPVITCPPNLTINCTQDYNNLALTGNATATDNCQVEITRSPDVKNLSACGKGTVRRTFKATDPQGLSATCTQTITLGDDHPFTKDDIIFPGDLTLDGCTKDDAKPEEIHSIPTYTNVDCADIAMSYDDEVFTVPGACLKILRTWRLIDWCSANQQNPVFITHVQKIILNNTTPPVIESGCGNRTINSVENDCEEYVEHSITASDDCTPVELLKIKWQMDLKNDGTVDQSGNGPFTAGIYPAGRHKMTYTVTDICGNSTTCSYIFHIKDNKPPTPICQGSVTWVLDQDGKAVVWASDFDLKSEDRCDGSDLKFSFNSAGTQPSKTFTCADISNGVSARIPLKMYAIDSDGNFEFCDVELVLQDSPLTNACPDNLNASTIVMGRIINTKDEGVQEVPVSLKNMTEAGEEDRMTNAEGIFEFEAVPYYNSYAVAPKKNDDLTNGISTLDLVLIQRHILGLKKFSTPYQLIAADVNNSKSVTASDLVALRKVLLGTSSAFPDNTSYRFIPAGTTFEDPLFPYDFNERFEISGLMMDMMHNDFTILKVGDVNESASYFRDNNKAENRNAPISISLSNKQFESGQDVQSNFVVESESQLLGMQFTLTYDPSVLTFQSFSSNDLPLKADNYSVLQPGKVVLSWSDAQKGIDKRVFDIYANFTSNKGGDLGSVSVNSDILSAESYNADLESTKIIFELNNRNDEASLSTQVVNSPNPFTDFTNIKYEVKKDSKVTLKVFDINGKTMMQIQEIKNPGHYSFLITNSNLNNTPGIYYYQIDLDGETQSGKMIMVK